MALPPLYQNLDAKNAAPGVTAVAVTPNDSTNLAVNPTRAIYVGVAGNLNVDMADGGTVLFSNVPVGMFPIQVVRVRSTSTTATNLVAIY